MITINNKKFAENIHEFMDSLFSGNGTCVGYTKRTKRTLKLLNHKGEHVGTINKFGVLLRVNKMPDGKVWYSLGTVDIVGSVEDNRFDTVVDSICRRRIWNGKNFEYYFK
jgi:hypothetical protein